MNVKSIIKTGRLIMLKMSLPALCLIQSSSFWSVVGSLGVIGSCGVAVAMDIDTNEMHYQGNFYEDPLKKLQDNDKHDFLAHQYAYSFFYEKDVEKDPQEIAKICRENKEVAELKKHRQYCLNFLKARRELMDDTTIETNPNIIQLNENIKEQQTHIEQLNEAIKNLSSAQKTKTRNQKINDWACWGTGIVSIPWLLTNLTTGARWFSYVLPGICAVVSGVLLLRKKNCEALLNRKLETEKAKRSFSQQQLTEDTKTKNEKITELLNKTLNFPHSLRTRYKKFRDQIQHNTEHCTTNQAGRTRLLGGIGYLKLKPFNAIKTRILLYVLDQQIKDNHNFDGLKFDNITKNINQLVVEQIALSAGAFIKNLEKEIDQTK